MLNGEQEGDIHRVAFTELWVVSQQKKGHRDNDVVPILPVRCSLMEVNYGSSIMGHTNMDRNG